MTLLAVGAAGGLGHDFLLGKGGGTNVSVIPLRFLQGNALYPALWTARRGVDGRHQLVFVSVVPAQPTADVERFPVADLVDASPGRACRSAPSEHRTPLSPLWRPSSGSGPRSPDDSEGQCPSRGRGTGESDRAAPCATPARPRSQARGIMWHMIRESHFLGGETAGSW